MGDTGPWIKYAALARQHGAVDMNGGPWDKYAALAAQHGAVDAARDANPPPPADSEYYAKNIGIGALKGLGQVSNALSRTLNRIPVVGQYLAPSVGIGAAQQLETPTNTAQQVGVIGGNLLGAAALTEAGGAAGAPFGVPGAVIGQAATGAALSPEHPIIGAAVGVGAEGGAQAAKKFLAPEFVNSALGIGERSKLFGKNPAQAVLDETSGIRAGALAKNIQGKVDELSEQLDTIAKANPDAKVSLQPALQKILDISDELHSQNYHDADPVLQKLWDHLTVNGSTGDAIPTEVSPETALQLKRGLQKRVTNWTPGAGSEEAIVAKQLQHILGNSISESVPETAPINARLSNLIEGGKRAGVTERSAGATQRFLNRVSRPTGALATLDIAGAVGGIPGAALAAGAQEGMSSPLVKMAIARGLNAAPDLSKPVAIPLWTLYQQTANQGAQ